MRSFRQASLLAVILCATTCAVDAQSTLTGYAGRPLDASDVRRDIVVLRQALDQVHAGYHRYAPARVMDTAFARLGRRADMPMTDLQLYRDVALLLAQIRCNHTKAEFPAALDAFRTERATHLPVRVRVFGKRLFVHLSADSRIARGTEILSINGTAVSDVVTRLSRYAAVDGFTDFARAALLERDDDLMGSDLDHYWPVEFGFASEWQFQLRTTRGVVRTISAAPITFSSWKALSNDTTAIDFANGTSWAMLDDTTARITLRSFVNYRTPVNPDSLYRPIFSQLQSRTVRHLIVDLRENGGGSDEASAGLVRYLTNAPVQLVRSVRRRTIRIDSTLASAFDTWGDRDAIFAPDSNRFVAREDGWFAERGEEGVVRPAAESFGGRVSVLMGRRNSSGATMLLAVLQEIGARTGRMRLVGEETGGSAEGPTAGQILFLRLPGSGIRVRIPLKRSDVHVTNAVAGMGVFPDVDATETLADFRAGVDRAMVVARTAPWGLARSSLAPAGGLWRGVLVYRDYGSGAEVTLPTSLHIAPIGATGAFRHRTIYDDGPGKTVYSTAVVRVVGDRWIEGAAGPEGEASDGESVMRIVSRRRTAEGQVLVLRGRGMDDNKRVEFRYTVTVGESVYRRLKEFRVPGGAWGYRHEYRLGRATSPAQ